MLALTINRDATFTLDCGNVSLEGLNLTLVLTKPTNPQTTETVTFTRDGNKVTTKYAAEDQQIVGLYKLVLYKNYGASGQEALKRQDFRLVPASEATRRTNDGSGDEGGGGGGESDRDTTNSSKGYVHVPLHLVQKDVVKIYSNVTWIHGVESTARTKSTATAAASYDSTTEYFEGNPTSYYGKDSGFPPPLMSKAMLEHLIYMIT